MNEPLTLDWIISTLKKSGINSKQIVIERLENCSWEELDDLGLDCKFESRERFEKEIYIKEYNRYYGEKGENQN